MVESTEKKQGSYHPEGNLITDAEANYTMSQGHDVDEIHVKSFFSISDRKIRYFM